MVAEKMSKAALERSTNKTPLPSSFSLNNSYIYLQREKTAVQGRLT